MLNDNHKNDADRGKIKPQLPLKHIFGFSESFKKLTKNFGFEITLRLLIFKTLYLLQ